MYFVLIALVVIIFNNTLPIAWHNFFLDAILVEHFKTDLILKGDALKDI